MRQSKVGRDRLIVHLYSDLNTTAFHALPNDDVPLREEVVPIHDIRVTFGASFRLGAVRLEPDGQALQVDAAASGDSSPTEIAFRVYLERAVISRTESVGTRSAYRLCLGRPILSWSE